jgi:hypothetical protein
LITQTGKTYPHRNKDSELAKLIATKFKIAVLIKLSSAIPNFYMHKTTQQPTRPRGRPEIDGKMK